MKLIWYAIIWLVWHEGQSELTCNMLLSDLVECLLLQSSLCLHGYNGIAFVSTWYACSWYCVLWKYYINNHLQIIYFWLNVFIVCGKRVKSSAADLLYVRKLLRALDKGGIFHVLKSLFEIQTLCCGYSKESSQWDNFLSTHNIWLCWVIR